LNLDVSVVHGGYDCIRRDCGSDYESDCDSDYDYADDFCANEYGYGHDLNGGIWRRTNPCYKNITV